MFSRASASFMKVEFFISRSLSGLILRLGAAIALFSACWTLRLSLKREYLTIAPRRSSVNSLVLQVRIGLLAVESLVESRNKFSKDGSELGASSLILQRLLLSRRRSIPDRDAADRRPSGLSHR